MVFLYFIILFILLLAVLLYTVALKTIFIFDTDKEIMELTVLWLYPFIKVKAVIKNFTPMISVFLFKQKVFTKAFKQKNKKDGLAYAKSIKFRNLSVTANYGFEDKLATGVACAALNMTPIFDFYSLQHHPDFLAIRDYIYLKVTTDIDILSSLLSYFKQAKILKTNGE
jgi:hypothetical protein